MGNEITLEYAEQLVAQLPPQEQLKLLAHVSQRLSAMPSGTEEEGEKPERREEEADRLLALCDAAAEKWNGVFDAAEEIRQMRRDRDERIWPSKS
ncbi:MAG: hypothetical protein FJ279_29950 [Planctomycetes bacterium]|nr:hypothetical protein [Planctomycetota bacterium]